MRNTAVSPRLRRHHLSGRNEARVQLDKTAVPTAVIDLDGQIEHANPAFAGLVGCTTVELEAMHLDEVVTHVQADNEVEGFLTGRPARGVVHELVSDPLGGRVIRTRIEAMDGSAVDVMLSYRVRTDDEGQPLNIFCQMLPADEVPGEQADLDQADLEPAGDLQGAQLATAPATLAVGTAPSSEAALRELLELNPNGVVIVDQRGRVLLHNTAAVTLLAIHPEDLAQARFPHSFDSPTPYELDLRDATGQRRVVEVTSKTIAWHDSRAHVVSMRDTAAGVRLPSEDDAAFLHDVLTGLPGRELFLNRLFESRRGSSATRSRDVAVAVVDLDRFEHINETFGRLVGDRVLQVVANRLTSVVRPGDYVARLGDDDFAILLQLSGSDDGNGEHDKVAARVLDALARPCDIEGQMVHCSPSIGIAMPRTGEDDVDTLAAAQNALITGRTRGTNIGRSDESASEVADESFNRISRNLPMAVEEGQLFLHYQPVFDLTDSTIVGLEALVRWEHPDDGLIAPNEFIRIADESGEIISLGEWILTEVVDQIVEWRMRRPDAQIPQVSINLTARQLLHPEFRQHAVAELGRRGVKPTAIRFEITEKALVERTTRMAEVLQQLSDDGFAIDLDDFGTGLSSLTHLQDFPISSIKIDRSYINRMMDDEKSQVMVQAIIAVAKTFDLLVVAEGIETADQKSCLYRWGCDQAQGYLLARPLTPVEASRFFLREEKSVPLNRSQGLLRRGVTADQAAPSFTQTYRSW
jgi:diguanylate cyclase (GGDEF)-like protein